MRLETASVFNRMAKYEDLLTKEFGRPEEIKQDGGEAALRRRFEAMLDFDARAA